MFKTNDEVVFIKDYEFEIMGMSSVIPKGTNAIVVEDNHLCVYIRVMRHSNPLISMYSGLGHASLMKDELDPYKYLKKV